MDTTTRQALGLIEAWGHLPLITALDAAIKAAQVNLASTHLVGGGLSTATVRGDVGAVRAAIDAAQATFNQMGAQGMTHVIARPDSAVWAMLKKDGLKVDDDPSPSGGGSDPAPSQAAPPAVKAEAKVPATKAPAEVPAVKAEAEPPAVKSKAEVPVKRAEPQPPMVKPEDAPDKKSASSNQTKAEVIKGYEEYPPVKTQKDGPKTDRKANKKPRKK